MRWEVAQGRRIDFCPYCGNELVYDESPYPHGPTTLRNPDHELWEDTPMGPRYIADEYVCHNR